MRFLPPILLALTLASTGCPQDPGPSAPAPAKTGPAPKTAAEGPTATEEERSPDPAPTRKPAPTEAPVKTAPPTPTPAASKRPLDLLSRTAGKVEFEEVDPDALNKKPKAVQDRTADAERRASNSSGKSAWRRPKGKTPARRPPPAAAGPLVKAKPNSQNRGILRAWYKAGQALRSRSWGTLINAHTETAQQDMLAYALQRMFQEALQRSAAFAQRNTVPPKWKNVRTRLGRFGVRPNALQLSRQGSGRTASYNPPNPSAIAKLVSNPVACYLSLMSSPTLASGEGTHRGLYWPGDLALVQVQGARARAVVLEAGNRARFEVYFRKVGREWLLASRTQRQR